MLIDFSKRRKMSSWIGF